MRILHITSDARREEGRKRDVVEAKDKMCTNEKNAGYARLVGKGGAYLYRMRGCSGQESSNE